MKREDDIWKEKKALFELLPPGEKWRAYFIDPLMLGAIAVQQGIIPESSNANEDSDQSDHET